MDCSTNRPLHSRKRPNTGKLATHYVVRWPTIQEMSDYYVTERDLQQTSYPSHNFSHSRVHDSDGHESFDTPIPQASVWFMGALALWEERRHKLNHLTICFSSGHTLFGQPLLLRSSKVKSSTFQSIQLSNSSFLSFILVSITFMTFISLLSASTLVTVIKFFTLTSTWLPFLIQSSFPEKPF